MNSTVVGKKLGKIRWLDLRGSGFSILERLCLEEMILNHHDNDGYIITGTHEARNHKILLHSSTSKVMANAAIVMGISGKPDRLLNVPQVKNDNVMTMKRFSGGGTVILDLDSIWVSIIGRPGSYVTEAFPRPIMEWTAEAIYGPMFQRLYDRNSKDSKNRTKSTLVVDSKSCAVDNSGRTISLPTRAKDNLEPLSFRLRENDYVLGDRKIGGNAQAIVKTGWIHHTSFLWDYSQENMAYLQLPNKRPDYRGDRDHNDFLMRIRDNYPKLQKRDFFQALKDTVEDRFDVDNCAVKDAMEIVQQAGGMQEFYKSKSRNKVLEDL